MSRIVTGSLARRADFADKPYDVAPVPQAEWAIGDFVLAEVSKDPAGLDSIESPEGEMIRVRAGDRVIGAFGHRAATLEGVGSFLDIRDGHLQALTSAGLFGAFTSMSTFIPEPLSLDYRGHILRGGDKQTMQQFALQCAARSFSVPTILIVGTSMSAGKTTTGRVACRLLSEMGLTVFGAKLTGAARYRDVLSFRSSGAAEVYDFADAGLPSTVLPADEFRAAIRPLLAHMDARRPDILVAEAGASPLEPYNGAAAIDELGNAILCTILCASDPYAVVGVQQAFKLQPDLVAGPATNTTAGIELVRKLTGVRGINVIDPDSHGEFRRFLEDKLATLADKRPGSR